MLSVIGHRLCYNLVRVNLSKYIAQNTTYSSCFLVKPTHKRLANIDGHNFLPVRLKSKNKKTNVASSTEEEESKDFEDDIQDKHTKIMVVNVNSMRLDLLVKVGLGVARNKVESLFYESKIRVNGQKVLKKSETLHVGDEIDVVKGICINNPDFLTVARVEILNVITKGESLNVKLRRCKLLTVENYEDKWNPT